MKRLLCALGVAALTLPAAQASPATLPGLVYTPGYGNSIVASFDPITLARSAPHHRLGGNASSWSWSPQRRYLAIASFPQRLTVIDVAAGRVVARIRLAAGGGVVRAVTWVRRNRVVAVVETPVGVTVSAVDPLVGRVVRRTAIKRPFTFEFERTPEGLVLLLGARGRIEPVRLASVDAEGHVRMVTVPQIPAGFSVRREQQRPGLAVDPAAAKAYVVSGDRVVDVDLRTLSVAGGRPLRTVEKVLTGSTRSAEWLGSGLIAISGIDWDAEHGSTPAGLELVDVRSWSVRVVDRRATSFTFAAGRVLVQDARSRRALGLSAYGRDGRVLYRTDLDGATWMKKHGRVGYACRDAFLRSVVDLGTGRTLRTAFPPRTRCPTLLADDSHG